MHTVPDRSTWIEIALLDLPAAPALDALSLDRDGNALVGLQDGSVVCVGTPQAKEKP
jgi:hypothetical protein